MSEFITSLVDEAGNRLNTMGIALSNEDAAQNSAWREAMMSQLCLVEQALDLVRTELAEYEDEDEDEDDLYVCGLCDR